MDEFDDTANIFDRTGYGPTSAGRAQSPTELRRANINRYHTGRAIEAMRFMDPAAIAASERLIQMASGKDRSPDSVRRKLFDSTAGQGVLDVAMMARSSGKLGYGDPREYSNNITQMVSGGYGQSFSEMVGSGNAQKARMTGLGQRVSGNGMTTERVAIQMQKQMLDDLYGEGQDADPSKLNGYDMEEASRVASRVVGRGGMGNMVTTIQNATMGQKIASAKDTEQDPRIKAGLAALTPEQLERLTNAQESTTRGPNGENVEMDKALNDITATMNNPKAEAALRDYAKSKDANVFNHGAAKKINETVQEVTKGMAALNDIYGSLSSDEAHAMLEKVNGGRITNKTQARAATRAVNNMRNAAEYAGIDPQAALSMFAAQQSGIQGMMSDAFGSDSRSETTGTKASAEMAARITPRALEASTRGAQANKRMRDLGFEGFEGDGRSTTETAADMGKMAAESTNIYKARSLAASDMIGMTDAQKEKLRGIAKKMDATDSSTEAGRREKWQLELAGRDVVDMDTYEKSGVGITNLQQGSGSAEKARFTAKTAREALKRSDPLMNTLEGAGLNAEDKAALNESAMDDLGGKAGLSRLAEIDSLENKDDRASQMDAFFKENRIGADKRKLYEKAFLGGSKDDKKRLGDYTRTMAAEDWSEGAGSAYADRETGRLQLANLQKNEGRRAMRDDQNNISASGIANAVFKGDIKDPFANADTAGATLNMMKAQGLDMEVEDTDDKGNKVKRNLSDMYSSGIDITKGFSGDALDKFDKVAGKKLNLHELVNKRMGTNMTRDEFVEKSKDDVAMQNEAYLALADKGAEDGFQVQGAADDMTIMDDETAALASKTDGAKRLKKLAATRAIFPVMGKGQQDAATEAIMSGNDAQLGDMLTADSYDENDWWDAGANDLYSKKDEKGNKYTAAKMAQGGKFMKTSQAINAASGEDMTELAKNSTAPAMLEKMKSQLTNFESAQKDGATKMYTYDDNGKQVEQDMNAESIAAYKEAINKLSAAIEQQSGGGGQKVSTMTVTKLEVTGDFNSSKK